MKSAFECFQHAAKCVRLAKTMDNHIDRSVLITTARHWQALGKVAKAREEREAPSLSRGPH